MARAISAARTMITITGDDTAPAECYTDYCVEDGDLCAPPKVKDEAAPAFNQAADAMCQAIISAIKTDESI